MIKPKRLVRGGTVGVAAPSGPVKKARLKRGVETLKKLGYKVKLSEKLLEKTGYLAGDDQSRAGAVNGMFADPKIDAIICARGGFGSIRILDELDYTLIRKNPKILVGYSDITLLLLAINKFCNLVTFHGPMVAVDFSELSDYNRRLFMKAVASSQPVGRVTNSKQLGKWRAISKGRASAPILGGNLTLITRLLGTKYDPDFRNKILFLEDLNEDIYKIDGMLAQLKLAGILRQVEGVVLAEFLNCRPSKKASLTLGEVFEQYFASAKYPVIYPVSCGHGKDKITIPLGVKASLNTIRGVFSIDETGVK
jgi:muramoyltetrapeptide carboxypeptidase